LLCSYTLFQDIQLCLNRGVGYSGPFPEIESDGLNVFLVFASDGLGGLLSRLGGGGCFACGGAASFAEAPDDRGTVEDVLISPGTDVDPVDC